MRDKSGRAVFGDPVVGVTASLVVVRGGDDFDMGTRSRVLVVAGAEGTAEFALRLNSVAEIESLNAVLPLAAESVGSAVAVAMPRPPAAPVEVSKAAAVVGHDDVVFTRVSVLPVVSLAPRVSPPFNLSCSYFAIAVANTGDILASRGLEEPAQIASITKVRCARAGKQCAPWTCAGDDGPHCSPGRCSWRTFPGRRRASVRACRGCWGDFCGHCGWGGWVRVAASAGVAFEGS